MAERDRRGRKTSTHHKSHKVGLYVLTHFGTGDRVRVVRCKEATSAQGLCTSWAPSGYHFAETTLTTRRVLQAFCCPYFAGGQNG